MKTTLIALFIAAGLVGCWTREATDAEIRAERTKSAAETAERTSTAASRAADDHRDVAKEKAIAQAAANLTPIADAVEIKGQPGIANVARDQKRNIDGALNIPANEYPAASVTLKGLLENAEAEREKAQTKANELQTALGQATASAEKAERDRITAEANAEASRKLAAEEKARADSEATTSWWLQAGGTALAVTTALAGLAARLGLPGGGLVSTILSVATPMLTQRRVVATAAVAAADVGRSALGILDTVIAADPELGAKLAAKVKELTGGRAEGIEELFKLAAKSFTVDDGNHVEGVDKLLCEIRGKHIDTVGGLPTVLSAILKVV